MNKNLSTKKRKLNKKRVILFLLILSLILFLSAKFITLRISNIYISGNHNLKDIKIMELAKVDNYPNALFLIPFALEKRLEKNDFIIKAKVEKKEFTKLLIQIEENYPVFYDSNKNSNYMKDGTYLKGDFNAPALLNYIPDTISKDFKEELSKLKKATLDLISEIKYDPNTVDEERFLFLMNDKNYVYINISRLNVLNGYLNIVKEFKDKKGILYLDYGNSFKILED